MHTLTKLGAHDDQDTYLLLVQEFPLRPIRSEARIGPRL